MTKNSSYGKGPNAPFLARDVYAVYVLLAQLHDERFLAWEERRYEQLRTNIGAYAAALADEEGALREQLATLYEKLPSQTQHMWNTSDAPISKDEAEIRATRALGIAALETQKTMYEEKRARAEALLDSKPEFEVVRQEAISQLMHVRTRLQNIGLGMEDAQIEDAQEVFAYDLPQTISAYRSYFKGEIETPTPGILSVLDAESWTPYTIASLLSVAEGVAVLSSGNVLLFPIGLWWIISGMLIGIPSFFADPEEAEGIDLSFTRQSVSSAIWTYAMVGPVVLNMLVGAFLVEALRNPANAFGWIEELMMKCGEALQECFAQALEIPKFPPADKIWQEVSRMEQSPRIAELLEAWELKPMAMVAEKDGYAASVERSRVQLANDNTAEEEPGHPRINNASGERRWRK